MENKACVQCGTPFYGASNKMYCSNACKQNAFREKQHNTLQDSQNDLPTFSQEELVWFMDLCLDYHNGKRLPVTELKTVLATFETVLQPFYEVDNQLQKPYLEVFDDLEGSYESTLCDMWCMRDVLHANLVGKLGRSWSVSKKSKIYQIDFGDLQTFDIIQNTFNTLKTYLN